MTFKHLEERSAYEERYDAATVEQCRWIEDHFLSPEIQQHPLSDGRGFPNWIMPLKLFHLTGERYRQREETINEWMERDRQRDAMIEQARPPLMRCPSCGQQMECVDTSIKYGFEEGERDRMSFFLTCKSCKEVHHIYENGTPIPRKPLLCSKCDREVEFSSEERDGKHYYIRTCKHCGHIEERMSTLDEEEQSPTKEEIERFVRDKKRFCISEAQGQRFLQWEERMKQIDKQKEEHLLNVELYDRVKEVKSLNIASLEKKLRKELEKAGYVDLHTTMLPSGREIVLEFSIRDMQDSRKDLESRKTLQETIESALEMTNWSLYPDSVTYRLGLLSGRIRGYESEEDLEKLTRSRMKKKSKKKKTEEVPIEF
jgi:hypothetical protein